MNELELIKSFGKLEVRDGDIIVLKSPEHLPQHVIMNILKSVKDIFEKSDIKVKKVIMLDAGMDIGIIRKEAGILNKDIEPPKYYVDIYAH